MISRYVVVAMAQVAGSEILLSVERDLYGLRDAIEARRKKQERHREIWPDTNVVCHIFRLERVPAFIENADLTIPDRPPGEMRGEFAAYLEASEALGQGDGAWVDVWADGWDGDDD